MRIYAYGRPGTKFFAISKIDVWPQNLGQTSRLDRERCIYVNTEGITSIFTPFSIRVWLKISTSRKKDLIRCLATKTDFSQSIDLTDTTGLGRNVLETEVHTMEAKTVFRVMCNVSPIVQLLHLTEAVKIRKMHSPYSIKHNYEAMLE